MDAMRTCTCTDIACAAHPSNHDDGCTRCIAKNQAQREVPSCLFKLVGRSERCEGWYFEDFALSVVGAAHAEGRDPLAALDQPTER